VRPRAIQTVPGLPPDGSPFERFREFARMIVSVPKSEADREMSKSGLRKALKKTQRRSNGKGKN